MRAQVYDSIDASDKENDDGRRPPRNRRASEREAQRLQDEADRAERKARKAEKKAERERKKNMQTAASTAAANVASQRSYPISDDEGDVSSDDDSKYTSHRVEARPQAIKKVLVQRNTRVPQVLSVDSDDDDSNDSQRGRTTMKTVRRGDHRIQSPPQPLRHQSISPIAHSDDLRSVKEPKQQTNARPKQADYSPLVQEVITVAIQLWRLKIFCENAFPTVQEEAKWVGEVWRQACVKLQVEHALDMNISRLITSRTSHTRGEVKTKVKAFVPSIFDLESSQHPKIIEKMRSRATKLKDGYNFVYKSPHKDVAKRKGLYRGKIIQKCVNAIWFANRRDEGVRFPDSFSPIPLPALALIFAAIENCIDEWITGIHTSLDFTATEYEVVYQDHLKSLHSFRDHSKHLNILGNICAKLYNTGRFHSGAQPLDTFRPPAITLDALNAAIDEYKADPTTETDGEDGNISEDSA
ncbi:hypothetical protein PTI98_012841 [Pleurotus ostreatus]|nr:hypothetical protein PTI98_012841 [Pleurotus ostreatus]